MGETSSEKMKNNIENSFRLNEIFKTILSSDCRDSSVSLCMVCAYVREDNPRALASGLSPVHTHNHTITAALLQPQQACALCAL